jgi:hypothetical protein
MNFWTSRRSAGYRLGPEEGTVKENSKNTVYIYTYRSEWPGPVDVCFCCYMLPQQHDWAYCKEWNKQYRASLITTYAYRSAELAKRGK